MKYKIYIHTNDKQFLGAKIAAHAFKSKSKNPNDFDIEFIRLEETPHLLKREGKKYIRKGQQAIWRNDDLQSFSPLRLMVPQLMNFEGTALIVDPDIFAVGDVYELLSRNMAGKAILCRNVKQGYRGNGNAFYATSVMLLDCSKLKHWKWDQQIDDLFAGKFDYGDWIGLKKESPSIIGEIDETWNSFDELNADTKLLHTTERSTQPWRTGLPVDFDTTVKKRSNGLLRVIPFLKRNHKTLTHYLQNPDPNQEYYILKLIKEALEAKVITVNEMENEISKSNLRKDIFEIIAKVNA